jgi:hypothetical protein
MKTENKKKAEALKTETAKSLENLNKSSENQNSIPDNQALLIVKKKLSVAEKLDKIQSFDAISGRFEYLTTKKKEVDQFGKSQNGFMGATLELEDEEQNRVKISNPVIIEELISIAKMRLQELIVKTEKEIEAFEV